MTDLQRTTSSAIVKWLNVSAVTFVVAFIGGMIFSALQSQLYWPVLLVLVPYFWISQPWKHKPRLLGSFQSIVAIVLVCAMLVWVGFVVYGIADSLLSKP